MKETENKKIYRDYFYRTLLPNYLSNIQLKSGHFFVLLEKGRELSYLDELGIFRNQIFSVEKNISIFHEQLENNWGVSLFYGEASKYLEKLIHENQSFQVFNIDIEGSYLVNLDLSIYSVLLFCWRNPETVVATYNTIGRDSRQIMEGIKSLLILLNINSILTKKLFFHQYKKYELAGFTNSINLVLRDLFWFRSHLENLIKASVVVGSINPEDGNNFLKTSDRIWKNFINNSKSKKSLKFSDLENISSDYFLNNNLSFDIVFEIIDEIIYRASTPWVQKCYATKFKHLDNPINLNEWLTLSIKSILNSPLTSIINKKISKTEEIKIKNIEVMDVFLWNDERIFLDFTPRKIIIPNSNDKIISIISKSIKLIKENLQNKKEKEMKKKNSVTKRVIMIRKGKLTESGIEFIRQCAQKSMKAEEVQKKLPQKISIRTIAAHIAIANRKSNKMFMWKGDLTEHGKNELRNLAKRNLNTKEIQKLVPATVPERRIRAFVAAAHR